jgi:hypothetical protein
VLIAGFTELTNNITAVNALNGGLCGALGVGRAQAVCTRVTAVGGTFDYTGIAVAAAGVNIRSWGRIIPSVSGAGVTLIHDMWNPTTNFANWAATLPAGATLDYQGLVYVVADIGGGIVFAVAFLHNIYGINDARGLILQRLPDAAGLIAADQAMPQGAGVVYICGDFNAGPLFRSNRAGVIALPFSQGTVGPGPPPPPWSRHAILTPGQLGRNFRPGGTTAAGSLYDYSFCSVIGNVPQWHQNPAPAIDVVTLDNGGQGPNGPLSDHAASLLLI